MVLFAIFDNSKALFALDLASFANALESNIIFGSGCATLNLVNSVKILDNLDLTSVHAIDTFENDVYALFVLEIALSTAIIASEISFKRVQYGDA